MCKLGEYTWWVDGPIWEFGELYILCRIPNRQRATGEVTYEILKVYVQGNHHLIHIGTSTGEDIETTENHPFYVDGRGWVAASELEEGETLHTEDGDIVTVIYNHDEWLKESVKVYNLEVEGLHTYYVTADRVLVHNEYKEGLREVPEDWNEVEVVEEKVKSPIFKEFLRELGENPKNWRKVMEKWASPDGIIFQRHYWTNGTKYYYHGEGIEEWYPH